METVAGQNLERVADQTLSAQSCIALLRDSRFGAIGGRPPFIPFGRATWGGGAPATAAWLRTIERAAARTPKPDLVWSGPEVPGLHARDTRRVYEELLGCAEHSILASTYAFFDGPKAFEVLARRMESRPTLRVTLLLNIQRKRSDITTSDQLVRRFADRFWNTDWPGSLHPSVFYDPRSLDLEGPGGVLHAKAVVADDEAVNATMLATQEPKTTLNNSSGSSRGSPRASACSISRRALSTAALASGAAYPLTCTCTAARF